jgi:hypothetical protein
VSIGAELSVMVCGASPFGHGTGSGAVDAAKRNGFFAPGLYGEDVVARFAGIEVNDVAGERLVCITGH